MGKGRGCNHSVAATPAAGSALLESGLSGGKAGNGHAQGRAGDVVEANLVEEGDRVGVATVLTADAEANVGADLAAKLDSKLHQLANTLAVKLLKGVAGQNTALDVLGHELGLGIVTGEAKGHLGEIVGAKAEELGLLGQLISLEGCAGHLNHCADLVCDGDTAGIKHLLGGLEDDGLLVLQLGGGANKRHHDVGAGDEAAARSLDSGLKDGNSLHLGDVGVDNSQAAATKAKHGVDLSQVLHAAGDLSLGDAHLAGELLAQGCKGRALLGQELVQRRVKETDGDGQVVHGLKDALEVLPLEALDLLEGLGLARGTKLLGGNHAPHRSNAGLAGEEHVLSAHEPNSRSSVVTRNLAVLGGVGVGVDLHAAEEVNPLHELADVAASHGGGNQILLAADHLSAGAVEGDPVTLSIELAVDGQGLGGGVHDGSITAAHTGLAPATSNHGSMGSHASAAGQDALGSPHASDVLRGGLSAAEDDDLTLGGPGLSLVGCEDHAANSSPGGGVEALGNNVTSVGLGVLELRVQELIQMAGVHHHHSLGNGDEPLALEVHSNLQGRGAGALAVTGLEHEEAALLDGELAVLHVLHVLLELVGVVHQVSVGLRERLGHLRNGQRGTDASHNVLALGVDKELAVQLVGAVSGAAREANAGAAPVAQVAVDHALHVDGGASQAADLVDFPVLDGTGHHPGHEDSADRLVELLPGVSGHDEAVAGVDVLVLGNKALQVVGGQLGVQGNTALLLDGSQLLLELAVVDLEHDVAVHVEEATVRVPGEALAPLGTQALDDLVVDAEVEHSVHHARHRQGGAGAHAEKQRVGGVGEGGPIGLLNLLHVVDDLVPDVAGELLALLVEDLAHVCGDGHAGRDVDANARHLAKAGALATELGFEAGRHSGSE